MKYVLAALIVIGIGSVAAYAADLSIDIDTPLLAADGRPMRTCVEVDESTSQKCLKSAPATFRLVAIQILSANDQSLGSNKIRAGNLAIQIANGKSRFSLDELKLIETQADKFTDPITVARIHTLLGEPDGK